MSGTQRRQALACLAPVPAALHQPLLDELEGRLRSVNKGATQVYNALRFLHHLSKAARSGQFVPNLGLAVGEDRRRAERTQRALASHKQNDSPAHPSPQADSPARHAQPAVASEIADRALTDLRCIMHVRTDEDD